MSNRGDSRLRHLREVRGVLHVQAGLTLPIAFPGGTKETRICSQCTTGIQRLSPALNHPVCYIIPFRHAAALFHWPRPQSKPDTRPSYVAILRRENRRIVAVYTKAVSDICREPDEPSPRLANQFHIHFNTRSSSLGFTRGIHSPVCRKKYCKC
jgi:hypothetical protein